MPIGVVVKIECEVVKEKRRLVQLKSWATDKKTHTIYAEADASFMLSQPIP